MYRHAHGAGGRGRAFIRARRVDGQGRGGTEAGYETGYKRAHHAVYNAPKYCWKKICHYYRIYDRPHIIENISWRYHRSVLQENFWHDHRIHEEFSWHRNSAHETTSCPYDNSIHTCTTKPPPAFLVCTRKKKQLRKATQHSIAQHSTAPNSFYLVYTKYIIHVVFNRAKSKKVYIYTGIYIHFKSH